MLCLRQLQRAHDAPSALLALPCSSAFPLRRSRAVASRTCSPRVADSERMRAGRRGRKHSSGSKRLSLGASGNSQEVRDSWSMRATPEAVGQLRHAVAAFASDLGVPDPPLSSVRLAVSEAVTNVVIHSYREQPTPGDVELEAEVRSGALHITVADRGLGFGPRVDSPGAGFGLPIIEQVSDGFEVRSREPSGAEFRFWFRLPVASRTAQQ